VLVIGGAGSIGSHYIKALLRFDVAKLVVVDANENGLTELVRDLRSAGTYRMPREFVTYPVNFGDRVFAKLFAAHGPFDIVANFAAHKHVRSEKDIFSIEAMIENNVLRARGLLDLLEQAPPQHFFCVSTDKAANPVNIMGASKKLMEELILAYADVLPIKTARFANVAFSNGSLPQGWLERLAKRQPWSCPLGIRRFFVSPIESGELCLMASIMGESGDIVFPKLDEARDMIPFDQVARDLLAALGMEADGCRSEEEALLRPRSGRNGECKNMRGAGEDERGACDRDLARGEPGDGGVLTQRRGDAETQGFYPHLCDHSVVAKSGCNGECKTGRGAGEDARGASDGGLARGEPGDGSVLTQRRGGAETQGFYPHARWPVYFFESDTSGEKPYEEFYTPGEALDLERFVNLGVVKNAPRRSLAEIDGIFASLQRLFASADVTKADVVHALKDYLPNFEHIETGKSLDQKM
jgi:nucleoside-diphosphate-sugar epimerase